MDRVYLTPAEFVAIKEQAAETTRRRLAGEFDSVPAESPHKQSRPGRIWTDKVVNLAAYTAPHCDPTPRGVTQTFTARATSYGPPVPFDLWTHMTTADWNEVLAYWHEQATSAAAA